ncbi:hypothetical protein PYW07_013986 [Mythimna separata]|uniref:Uncharacterized protein n=1 Tax=Mythimna separata TaxID=271217 RepID=A0AAD8DQD5_MYTSE|nr:hypothetical protein PYW07_013986 [Mythimna separata]
MFHLRKISTSARVSCRLLSSQVKPLVSVSVDNEGIALMKLDRAPVNSISVEVLQSLQKSICEVEKNQCKGLVLASASPTIFSAGLDLYEFYKPDPKRFMLLTHSIYDAVLKIFGTDIITTMAINGYTGAGACVLATAFDYRAMTTGRAVIGLNDTAVGISPALWIVQLMTRLMGPKNAEYACTSSVMYPAEKALQVGLIDEVATDKEDAIEKCKAFIRSYDHISPVIRATTKRAIRQEFITDFESNRKKYAEDSLARAMNPDFQETIERYIQSIKQRHAAKALNK